MRCLAAHPDAAASLRERQALFVDKAPSLFAAREALVVELAVVTGRSAHRAVIRYAGGPHRAKP